MRMRLTVRLGLEARALEERWLYRPRVAEALESWEDGVRLATAKVLKRDLGVQVLGLASMGRGGDGEGGCWGSGLGS